MNSLCLSANLKIKVGSELPEEFWMHVAVHQGFLSSLMI